MKKNIVYIVSNINKSLAFEWIATYLNSDKYHLVFILLHPSTSALEDFLKTNGVKVYHISYAGKKDLLSSFRAVYKILRDERADIVHTHLMEASLVGLSAAWLAGIKKRIHTRHNSTFHHLYFPRAVWYDKLINLLSTDIVSISKVVTDVLEKREGVNPQKIHLIYHGFLFENRSHISTARVNAVKVKYDLNKPHGPVVGVISRFIEWKGIQYIIPAFASLLQTNPNAVLVLANAQGPYSEELHVLLAALPKRSYRVIPFEEDVFALYNLFDVFVHVPVDQDVEAYGQTYVEALSIGVPSVFTLSGIANEFIKDRENALVVAYRNSEQIASAVELLLTDHQLAQQLVMKGKSFVWEKFKLQHMICALEELYDQ